MKTFPLAYFITFTTYGTRLHGGKGKMVDRFHNKILTPYLPINSYQEHRAKLRMSESEFLLDNTQRIIILQTIKQVCRYRQWELIAAHVRTNHVHMIISAETEPEKIMKDVKSYSSRHLNKAADIKRAKYWAHHGSTRYLWETENIYMAIRYVVLDQGNQFAVFKNEKYSLDISECL